MSRNKLLTTQEIQLTEESRRFSEKLLRRPERTKRYLTEKEIGRGAMGVINLVHGQDLHRTRNMRLAFKSGFYVGGVKAVMMDWTRGAFPGGKIDTEEDAAEPRQAGGAVDFNPDGQLAFEKQEREQDPRSCFNRALLGIVGERFQGCVDGTFLDRMYQTYQEEGSPEDLEGWLLKRLEQEFVWIERPPEWRLESEWPLRNGVPTVFVTQYDVPDNEVAKMHYIGYETIYVFGFRVDESEEGVEVDHIVVSQLCPPQQFRS